MYYSYLYVRQIWERVRALSPLIFESLCCLIMMQTATSTRALGYLVKHCALHYIAYDVVSRHLTSRPAHFSSPILFSSLSICLTFTRLLQCTAWSSTLMYIFDHTHLAVSKELSSFPFPLCSTNVTSLSLLWQDYTVMGEWDKGWPAGRTKRHGGGSCELSQRWGEIDVKEERDL